MAAWPEKGKRTQEACPHASTTHSPCLSPAVPEPDLLVIVATNDDMVPTHHIITVGKDIDGPGAWGPRSRALASEKGCWKPSHRTSREAEVQKPQRSTCPPQTRSQVPFPRPKPEVTKKPGRKHYWGAEERPWEVSPQMPVKFRAIPRAQAEVSLTQFGGASR